MSRIAARAIAAALLAASASAQTESRLGDWRLWPSPWQGREVADQAQTAASQRNRVIVKPHLPVGQVFVPARSPLLRAEFMVHNRGNTLPGRIRLYRWVGDRDRSVAAAPLFEDVLELSGRNVYQRRSVFPKLPVEPGAPLYFEFTTEGRPEYGLQATTESRDHYPKGDLIYRQRESRPTWDLWFRTFSGPADAEDLPLSPREPELRASDPKLPWHAPAAAPRGTQREQYLERFTAYIEANRAGFARSCKDQLDGESLLEGLLYRASCAAGRCDERAVESLRGMFANIAALRFCRPRPAARACPLTCDPNPRLRFWWLQHPALAYLWTRSSPVYGPGDHARIRELLLDSAERLWPIREIGVHNRSLHLATGYLALSLLYPDAPNAGAWRDHARGVWEEFRRFDDTLEDSAQYTTGISLPAVLAYAELAGAEAELWSDADFLALVERIFQQTAPVGAYPNFGDSAGWARDPGGLIWLFEEAATRTRDPRYRWLAGRLYAYTATRLRDARPREDALHATLPYLGFAAIDADESIEPVAPAAQAELVASAQTQDPNAAFTARLGAPVGQVFVAARTPLVRLDLDVRADGEGTADVSVWRWRGDRETTVKSPPHFRESVRLGARAERISLLPLLEVEENAAYYLEIEPREGSISVAGSRGDAYAGGSVVVAGRREPASDLWFSTATLSPGGSQVTTRRDVVPAAEPSGSAHAADPRRRVAFGDRRVPDKLVLRSGFDPDDLHAVVNLLRSYPHGQDEQGAIVSLVDGGSVLIADTPFPYAGHVILSEDESAALLRRYWGGGRTLPDRHAEVTHFTDARYATIAWVEWDDPGGWDVRQERRFLFVKNRFLLVRDRFGFAARTAASAGPVWHVGDVHPQHGDHWFDTWYREPLSNVWKVSNPERYALLYFVPRSGRSQAAFLEESYLPPAGCRGKTAGDRVPGGCSSGPPYVVYQRWTGEAEPRATLWFDTLILPHGRDLTPAEAASRVRVVYSDDANVALEVRWGDETWTVVDRPGPAPILSGELATDAQYALIRTARDRDPYVLTRAATRLQLGDLRLDWPVHTSVERGATLPISRGAGSRP